MKTHALASAALVAAAIFGMTACGGEDSPTNASPTSPQDVERQQKFIECLREHGMDVPDAPEDQEGGAPQFEAAQGSAAVVDAAQAACAQFAPPQGAEEVDEDAYDTAVKKAECLRQEGISAKDPEPGTTRITLEEGADSQEDLVAAYSTCNEKYPSNQGG
ncbi:hypothetical protein ABZX40_05400 [Streptomyces sp. NPDC004610]|uniref:hypothetical protein n=1 Tax=unclassified Streptomyces TaxID=2593676 RepID=UPI0033A2ABB4